ncbi:hypothetical protein, partial [Actinoplanes sp. GCM10030250]|uniref:NucA/NucB deoxyribonuclease domain-containing protein n=1 Tax=Actinoplanes sp. GCM10030250 TaxID=3273376 RepID=UPI003611FEFC
MQWDIFLDSFIPVVNPAGVDLTAPMSIYVACRSSVGSTCLTNPVVGLTRTLLQWKASSHYVQTMTTTSPAVGDQTGQFDFTTVFNNPTNGSRAEPVAIAGRCDNALYLSTKAACSFPNTVGVFHLDYNVQKIQPAVAFMYNAMHNLSSIKKGTQPGQYVPGGFYPQPTKSSDRWVPLTREYPATAPRDQAAYCTALFGANYTQGKDAWGRPETRSCDEYPFFATKENMYRPNPPANETWAVYPVNAKANSKVGSDLAGYYARERILNDDTFYVSLDNVPPGCCATNDENDTPTTPPAPPSATPSRGPVMSTGSVASLTGASALSAANGVAVLGGSSYTAEGNRIMKINNDSGLVSFLAGNVNQGSGCTDATQGADAKFNTDNGFSPLRVVGADNQYVYATDYCGVRRIDPQSGAVTALTMAGTFRSKIASVAIAGDYMYTVDNTYGGLARINLSTRVRDVLHTGHTGAVSADDDYVWIITNDTLFKIDHNNGAIIETRAVATAGHNPTALLSVGNYLYATLWTPGETYPILTRITKTKSDGKLDGTGNIITQSNLTNINGIGSDGDALYLADSFSSGGRLWTVETDTPFQYDASAQYPILEGGDVQPLTNAGALSKANGAAVLDDTTYVADGNRIMKIDNNSGEVSFLAGNVNQGPGCVSAAKGEDAKFNTDNGYSPLRVVGADGRFVYATDYCGVRRIDPDTGAVTSLTMAGTFRSRIASVAIAGQFMYTVDNTYGGLARINLSSGARDVLHTGHTGAVAADDDYVWIITNDTLFKIDHDNGAILETRAVATAGHNPTALLSVDNYLYANLWTPGETYPTLTRITKINETGKLDGTGYIVATYGFRDITGIASDGMSLQISDSLGSNAFVQTVSPSSPFGFPLAASTPVMDNGAVSTANKDPLSAANGVAVLGGYSYTAEGNRIMKIDNDSGLPSFLAGNVNQGSGCVSAASGGDAKFNTDNGYSPLRVVGADGRFVYATDYCGVRRIDPQSGAVTSLTMAGTFRSRIASVAIAGQFMYTVDNTYGGLAKIDLNSGARVVLHTSHTGAVAADDDYVWIITNDTLFKIDHNNGAVLETRAVTTTGHNPTALLSVGNFLYASIWTSGETYPTLTRITKFKSDGTLDGTGNVVTMTGLANITGVVTDGTFLYVSDVGSVKKLTSVRAFAYPPAASTPVMDNGAVSTVNKDPLSAANGVAVLGGFTYTAEGNRIMKIDNDSGLPSFLTGNVNQGSGCVSATKGEDAKFNTDNGYSPLRVVGADGRFVYATDYCGVRRIDPQSGAVTSLTMAGTFRSKIASVAIAGQYMYTVDNTYGGLARINLSSGTRDVLHTGHTGAVAADDDYVWIITNDTLFKIDRGNGAVLETRAVATTGHNPTALLSVGNYLYASLWTPGETYPILTRITKTKIDGKLDGTGNVITMTGLANISGVVTDGTFLYVSDVGSVKKLTSVRAFTYPPAASTPVMDNGAVSTVNTQALSAANGVAVLGGFSYT